MKQQFTALLAASVLFLSGCSAGGAKTETETTVSADTPATPLTVTFMKVGKADGAILQTANHTVVIDCGEKSDGKKMVARLQEYGVETVDALILTHYDQDHIGGAPKVIGNFSIGQVIGARQKEESKRYNQLSEALDAKGLELELPGTPLTFTLDDAVFTVYPHKICNILINITCNGLKML